MSRFSTWSSEPYSITEIEFLVNNDLLKTNLSSVRLIGDSETVPIGFLVFDHYNSSRGSREILVDEKSSNNFKIEIFNRFLERVIDRNYNIRTVRSKTGYLRQFFESFNSEAVIDRGNAVSLFRKYSDELNHLVRIYDSSKKIGITTATASKRQSEVIIALESFVDSDAFNHTDRILTNSAQTQHTQCPDEIHLQAQLSSNTSLFVQLSKALFEGYPFPICIDLHGSKLNILPTPKLHVDDTENSSYQKGSQNIIGFDFKSGKLRSRAELYEILSKSRGLSNEDKHSIVGYQYHMARRIIDEGNSDPLSNRCIRIINLIITYYFRHLQIVTGMNTSQMLALDVDSDIEYKKSGRKFTGVKMRAGGKIVSFEIQSIFLKYFEKFLSFRENIFARLGYKTAYLFFMFNGRHIGFKRLTSSYILTTSRPNSDPFIGSLEKVTSRQYRVFKGKWVADKHGIEVASFILQHRPRTNVASYNSVSQEVVDTEFTDFFNKLGHESRVVIRGGDGVLSTPSGGCASEKSPEKNTPDLVLFEPDCERYEGCLFCKHYAVHADEEDVRKLFSMLFLAEIYRDLADSPESYSKVFDNLSKRVEFVISEIASLSKDLEDLVFQVKEDVFEKENLDYYWQKKYELLADLGVL